MSEWKFTDPPNVAVISTKHIMLRTEDITYVSHDADNGGWQFLGSGPVEIETAAVVSLRDIVEIDRSIPDLADLPEGWTASRLSKGLPWLRKKY